MTLISRLEQAEAGSGLSDVDKRILSRLDTTGDCWLWTGKLDCTGRGRVWRNGKIEIHHRAVWKILRGPIPDGAKLCHHCGNPTCANPDHIYVGTQKTNVADMMARGRHWTTLQPERAREVASKVGKANTYPQKGLTMVDDGWKGGTDPQAYVDGLKKDALTMVEQVDRDAADAYRETHGLNGLNRDHLAEALSAHRIAAEARGMEKAAKIVEASKVRENIAELAPQVAESINRGMDLIAAAIRAALNGGQHE
jgi:hypothetical protein